MAKRSIHKVNKDGRPACICSVCYTPWIFSGTMESHNPETDKDCLLDLFMSDCEHRVGIICTTVSKTKVKKTPVKKVSKRKPKIVKT